MQINLVTLKKREYQKIEEQQNKEAVQASSDEKPASEVGSACSIMDPDCEACQ